MNSSKNQDLQSNDESQPYLIHEEKNRGINENNHDADQESAYKDQVLYPSIQNYEYFDQRDSYQELQESEFQKQSPIYMNYEVGKENEIDMGGGKKKYKWKKNEQWKQKEQKIKKRIRKSRKSRKNRKSRKSRKNRKNRKRRQ